MRRAAIRWYGGKHRLASKIIEHFPPHHHYVEPYSGGGSILLAKSRSAAETYNDLDGGVVGFFKCLRDDPEKLVRLIDLTPFSLAEFDQALREPVTGEPFEDARRFYVRAQQGRAGGSAKYRSGWRRYKTAAGNTPPAVTWDRIEHLHQVARRLKGVQIEQSPALEIIARYDKPDTLFYLDPPYPFECRSRQWGNGGYMHEMTPADHYELGKVLHEIEGMAIISCKHCPMYDTMYADWQAIELQAYYDGNRPATEVIWLSPGIQAAQSAAEMTQQRRLL